MLASELAAWTTAIVNACGAELGHVDGGMLPNRLESFAASDIRRALVVLEQFKDLDIGVADASIVVLAERYRVADVLTLDERHFRPLRHSGKRPFRLVPADA